MHLPLGHPRLLGNFLLLRDDVPALQLGIIARRNVLIPRVHDTEPRVCRRHLHFRRNIPPLPAERVLASNPLLSSLVMTGSDRGYGWVNKPIFVLGLLGGGDVEVNGLHGFLFGFRNNHRWGHFRLFLFDRLLRRGSDRSWSRFRLLGSGLRLCGTCGCRRIGRFPGIPTHDDRHKNTPSIQSLCGIDAHLHTQIRNNSANHFWRNGDRHFGIRHLCRTRAYYIIWLCSFRLVCAIVLRVQRKRSPLTFMLSFRFSEDRIQSYDGVAILHQKR